MGLVKEMVYQLFNIFLNSPFNILLNYEVLSHLTPNVFEFSEQKNKIPLILLVDTFL